MADFRNLGNGKYMVFHEGKADGLVGWLTRYRREVYRSMMGTINNGQRLIPLRFEENSIIGKWFRKKTTVYDYAARKVSIEIEKEGEKNREELEIPLGIVYDDPVTAFYNFRFGVYGKVEPGKGKRRSVCAWLQKWKPQSNGRRKPINRGKNTSFGFF